MWAAVHHLILREKAVEVQWDVTIHRRQPLGQALDLLLAVVFAGNQECGHLHMTLLRRQGDRSLHRFQIATQSLVPLWSKALQVDTDAALLLGNVDLLLHRVHARQVGQQQSSTASAGYDHTVLFYVQLSRKEMGSGRSSTSTLYSRLSNSDTVTGGNRGAREQAEFITLVQSQPPTVRAVSEVGADAFLSVQIPD